jgi:hypothetical protein
VGHFVNVHKADGGTITHSLRCVEQTGLLNGQVRVTFLRVSRPTEVEQTGIVVTGWETFDQHPDLIVVEGYLTRENKTHLERKSLSGSNIGRDYCWLGYPPMPGAGRCRTSCPSVSSQLQKQNLFTSISN